MVKKKAPFIPITIIVIGVGLIFAINAKSRPVDPEDEARLQREKAGDPPDRPAADPDKIHDTLKAGLGADGSPKQAASPTPKINTPGGTGQYMLAPKDKVWKPQPSATNTSSQWYKPN